MSFYLFNWLDLKMIYIGQKLDNLLKKKPFFAKVSRLFFENTAFFTNFILFNDIVFFFFNCSIGLIITIYYDEFSMKFIYLKLYGITSIPKIVMSLPISVQIFMLFIWCFYSIIFINTFLCYSSIISLYMKNKYGENIMRTLHHNHGFGQAVRSAVPAVTAFCIFCYKDYVELQKVKTVEEAHVRVCEIAAKAGQPIPQQHPTTVVVHTTHSTNSKF